MSATLIDNNAKLDNLEKAIRAANERRRKLIEKNKLITYDFTAKRDRSLLMRLLRSIRLSVS